MAQFLSTGQKQGHVQVIILDYPVALQIGVFLARVRTADVSVTDAMIAWAVLRYGGMAYTSDPQDLRRLISEDQLRAI